MTRVKICGLTTPEAVDAAVAAGADYLGFMLFPRSPRALTAEAAGPLIARAQGRARTVVILVDPDDTAVDAAASLGPDLIQLHGRETPARTEAIRRRTGRPLIKALPVESAEDVAAGRRYTADHLMFDAKPPAGADRLGGHGAVFDWSLLSEPHPSSSGLSRGPAAESDPRSGPQSRELTAGGDMGPQDKPEDDEAWRRRALWFLAGGLTPGNVAEAIRVTSAPVVDVSTGVESAPGVKDPALIAAFVRAAKAARP